MFVRGKQITKYLKSNLTKSCRLLNSEDALHELYFGGQMFMPMSIMVWNKVYKRSLFDNLRFAEGYIHEDVQITPMLLNRANRIVAFNHWYTIITFILERLQRLA